ncbi:MAG: Mlc titration factor MtfA (ptsG expression regulator) [Planctomycetaceae bacterium]|jgi:Mlc titration factor MtfA (ptsG expression regulator)
MIFKWLRQRRRRKILNELFPVEWDEIIRSNVFHDRQLTEEQRVKLRRNVQVFVSEKNWEGCHDLTVTDEMRVTVAAQACLLTLGMDDVHFDHVLSVLIYPTAYVAPDTAITREGVCIDGGQTRLGEAWYRGPVVLSWADAVAGGRHEQPGHNLVLHEFAHQLDMMNGRQVDGTPLLDGIAERKRWGEVLEPVFRQLQRDCEHGHHPLLDCYAATNEAEFFAVLTESFFENPRTLLHHAADTYNLLVDYFQLDPARWTTLK